MNHATAMTLSGYLAAALGVAIYDRLSRRAARLPRIPLGWLLTFLVVKGVETGVRPFTWADEWRGLLDIGSTILFSWALARLAVWLVIELPGRFRQGELLPNITRDFILVVAFIGLLFIVLRVKSGVNLAQLMTTSAVLTAVVGLAAQTPLKGFFSGLVLRMEQPIRIGDYIEFAGFIGKVVGITWKSTELVTMENELILIPNADLVSGAVRNMSRPSQRRIIRMFIGLPYETPPNKVRRVILDVLTDHPDVLGTPAPEVRLTSFDDFSIRYEIRFWHEKIDRTLATKAEINNALWYALARNDISIPFPIRDVRLAHLEHKEKAARRPSEISDICRILASVSVLEPLGEPEIRRLAGEVHVERYGTGDRIVRMGQPGDSMYIVRSGRCQVVSSPSYRGVGFTTIGEGDFFGEMSLLTGAPRSATVQALEDTEVIAVKKETLSAILKANPGVFEALGHVAAKRQAELSGHLGETEVAPVAPGGMVQRIMAFFGYQ